MKIRGLAIFYFKLTKASQFIKIEKEIYKFKKHPKCDIFSRIDKIAEFSHTRTFMSCVSFADHLPEVT